MGSSSGTATPNGTTEASDEAPYAAFPPRLSVCLNDLTLLPDRTQIDSDPFYMLPYPPEQVFGAAGAGIVQSILEWIATMLKDVPLEIAWLCPAGRPDWVPDDMNEENWAKRISQMFLGLAYGGPSIAADFQSAKFKNSFGAGDVYVYQRFQPKYRQWEKVSDLRTAPDDAEWITNTDPAYSLVVACQYLSTYAVLSRGFTLEDDLNSAGIPARQCPSLSIFRENGGVFYGLEKEIEGEEVVTSAVCNVKVAVAEGISLAPGTVFTFNPHGTQKFGYARLPKTTYEKLQQANKYKDGKNAGKINQPLLDMNVELADMKHKADFKQSVKDAGKDLAAIPLPGAATLGAAVQKYEPVWVPPTSEQQSEEEMVQVKVPLRVQLPGSHVSCVLRRWTLPNGNPAIQLLDTNSHTEAIPGAKVAPTIPFLAKMDLSQGMTEGSPLVAIQSESNFAGLGVPPERAITDEQLAHLAKVRPVGLARLIIGAESVVDKRPYWADPMPAERVLYVSPMVLTWGPGDTDNYPIARFALSLRNIPYYASLTAYWIIYAPRRELADVMWAEGSRGRSIVEIFEDAKARRASRPRIPDMKNNRWVDPTPLSITTADALACVAVCSSAPDGGTRYAFQGHYMKFPGRGKIPKFLRTRFIDAASLKTSDAEKALDEVVRDPLRCYIHPTVGSDYDGITAPRFFQSPEGSES
jgi:hypothetical protein